jgi:hypothetical protein
MDARNWEMEGRWRGDEEEKKSESRYVAVYKVSVTLMMYSQRQGSSIDTWIRLK